MKLDEFLRTLSPEFEQAEKGMEQLACILGLYRKQLVQAGFNREEALAIVRDWHIEQLRMNRPPPPDSNP